MCPWHPAMALGGAGINDPAKWGWGLRAEAEPSQWRGQAVLLPHSPERGCNPFHKVL